MSSHGIREHVVSAGSSLYVFGLDPAGPQWGNNHLALNRNDGQYVKSIHTDGSWYGVFDVISDADFYPNGGRHASPGCWVNFCSHGRAPDLLASSIRNNRFGGRRCADLDQVRNNQCTGANFHMGNSILSKRGSGLYKLQTGSSWPF